MTSLHSPRGARRALIVLLGLLPALLPTAAALAQAPDAAPPPPPAAAAAAQPESAPATSTPSAPLPATTRSAAEIAAEAQQRGEAQARPGSRVAHPEEQHVAPHVNLLWAIPFALLLLSIATIPAIDHHKWEKIYPYIAIGLGAITATYYLFLHHELGESRYAWFHSMREYVSFTILLGSLYTVSGGIVIGISRKATPITNCVLLLTGAVIANIVGTTGAAMLLIRPFIRMNRDHLKPYHIVFFIFIVANCGGALTPIGDPPLFMGFLRGVPFFWTTHTLWPMWIVAVGVLLVIFFVIDEVDHRKAARTTVLDAGPGVSIFGFQNFVFVGLILVAVFQRSVFDFIDEKMWWRVFVGREVIMVAAAAISMLTTKPYIYARNEFNWGPIREVAILFLGIFSTMVPALNWLSHNADRMPLKTAGQYYAVTGVLSSVLDNAPTYLVFLETNQAQTAGRYRQQIDELLRLADDHRVGEVPMVPTVGDPMVIAAYKQLVVYHRKKVADATVGEQDVRVAMTLASPRMSSYLIAISLGAVFFGAATYIGNGPNFMVKSIAESQGIRMPTFGGYVLKYTIPYLLPVLVLIWAIFFYFELWG